MPRKLTGDPFGATGTSQPPYGFTGEPTDSNGLVYLRARHYSPALGVFPSRDPFAGAWDEPMSINGYSYVHGNPANWVDSSGLQCVFSPVNVGSEVGAGCGGGGSPSYGFPPSGYTPYGGATGPNPIGPAPYHYISNFGNSGTQHYQQPYGGSSIGFWNYLYPGGIPFRYGGFGIGGSNWGDATTLWYTTLNGSVCRIEPLSSTQMLQSETSQQEDDQKENDANYIRVRHYTSRVSWNRQTMRIGGGTFKMYAEYPMNTPRTEAALAAKYDEFGRPPIRLSGIIEFNLDQNKWLWRPDPGLPVDSDAIEIDMITKDGDLSYIQTGFRLNEIGVNPEFFDRTGTAIN